MLGLMNIGIVLWYIDIKPRAKSEKSKGQTSDFSCAGLVRPYVFP